MLQIISGKFFTRQERFVHEGKGVLYSNAHWVAPIETCVAKLEPTWGFQGIATYVVSYVNQIEKPENPNRPGVLVRAGDPEILDQFEVLCIFGLGAWFSSDKNDVEIMCRKHPGNAPGRVAPRLFVPKVFELERTFSMAEVGEFVDWVERVIALPRDVYGAVISVLSGMRSALRALNHDLNLAYSILVYCLESLSQRFDGYEPVWLDYDESVRGRLDKEFASLDAGVADRIRGILVKEKHLKLSKRFVDFVTSNVRAPFFVEEASAAGRAVRQSELARALGNAYGLRSNYVHALEPLREQIAVSHWAHSDVVVWEREPYFTFAGLFRLAHHVVSTFVGRQLAGAQESVDWRSELPGSLRLEVDPKYWVHQVEGLSGESAIQYCSGVLAHVVGGLSAEPQELVDLRPLVQKAMKLVSHVSSSQRRALLCICAAWNWLVGERLRVDGVEASLEKHGFLSGACSFEAVVAVTLIGGRLPWGAAETLVSIEEWRRRRFKKSVIDVPIGLELAMIGIVANLAREEGRADLAARLLRDALRDAAGSVLFQRTLSCAIVANVPVEVSVFLPYLTRLTGEGMCVF